MNVVEARIADLKEIVAEHESGAHLKFVDNPKTYFQEVVVPFNAIVIEALIGKEFHKDRAGNIILRKQHKLPTNVQLLDIFGEVKKFEAADHLYAAAMPKTDDQLRSSIIQVSTEISKEELTSMMAHAVGTYLTPDDFIKIAAIGVMNYLAYRRKRNLFIAIAIPAVIVGSLILYKAFTGGEKASSNPSSSEVSDEDNTYDDLSDVDEDLTDLPELEE